MSTQENSLHLRHILHDIGAASADFIRYRVRIHLKSDKTNPELEFVLLSETPGHYYWTSASNSSDAAAEGYDALPERDGLPFQHRLEHEPAKRDQRWRG